MKEFLLKKERQSWQRASRLARRIPLKVVVSALRKDRDRE